MVNFISNIVPHLPFSLQQKFLNIFTIPATSNFSPKHSLLKLLKLLCYSKIIHIWIKKNTHPAVPKHKFQDILLSKNIAFALLLEIFCPFAFQDTTQPRSLPCQLLLFSSLWCYSLSAIFQIFALFSLLHLV